MATTAGIPLHKLTPTPAQWQWALTPLADRLCKAAVAQVQRKGARHAIGIDSSDLYQEALCYIAAKQDLIQNHLANGREDYAIGCIRSRLYRVAKLDKEGGAWETLTETPTL